MRICFIGLGSIATRHINNLKAILGNDASIDVLRSGKGKKLSDELSAKINKVCYSVSELDEHYDAVFITNPTTRSSKESNSMESISQSNGSLLKVQGSCRKNKAEKYFKKEG